MGREYHATKSGGEIEVASLAIFVGVVWTQSSQFAFSSCAVFCVLLFVWQVWHSVLHCLRQGCKWRECAAFPAETRMVASVGDDVPQPGNFQQLSGICQSGMFGGASRCRRVPASRSQEGKGLCQQGREICWQREVLDPEA